MHVEYDTTANFSHPRSTQNIVLANQTTDYTGHVKLEGLSPDTVYYYRVLVNDSSIYDNKNLLMS